MAIIGYIWMLVFSIAFLHWWWNNSVAINWPIVGMIPGLVYNTSGIHDYVTYALKLSGGTVLFKGPWFSGMNFVVTCDSRNVHHILSKNFANYQKGKQFRELVEVLGDGVINSDTGSDKWRIQNRMVHSLFSSKWYEAAVERAIEQKILNGLFQVLENFSRLGTEFDLQDILRRLTFDNICILVFGFDPSCLSIGLPQVPIEKAFHAMEKAVFRRHIVPRSYWKLQKWLQIGEEKKFTQAYDTFAKFVEQSLTEKREKFTETKTQLEKTKDLDLLTYFLTLEDVEGGGESGIDIKSNKFLKDMAFNLVGAGSDTVSSGLVWLLWLVASHPSVEQKILEEIKANLPTGEKWRPFSFEELRKLTYLHAVISETLRLYPSIPFNHLVSIGSDTLPSGLNLPKNMRVLYSFYSMGRMEDLWGKDCLEFKPERWISEQGQLKHVPSYKFIAFNAGPRICLGKNMAFQEIKAVASAIIWNFSIQVVENHAVVPSNLMVLYMKYGLKVKISKRTNHTVI